MGCDYYTWVETVILYRDVSGNSCKFVDKPEFEQYTRRYCYGPAGHDPDFDDPPEGELEREIREYGTKLLFNDGEWLCKEAGKTRIVTICAEEKIPVGQLVRVFKQMNGYWR